MEKKKVAVPLVCHGHSRPVVDLCYSPITPDGFFLISASKDSSPMLRNGETGDWIGTFEGHKGAVWSCCLDVHALHAATGSADFSADSLGEVYRARLKTRQTMIVKRLWSGVREAVETVGVWQFGAGVSGQAEDQADHGSEEAVEWGAQGGGDSGGGNRKIWDALTGDELQSFEHKHIVRACAFSEVKSRFAYEMSFRMSCTVLLLQFPACTSRMYEMLEDGGFIEEPWRNPGQQHRLQASTEGIWESPSGMPLQGSSTYGKKGFGVGEACDTHLLLTGGFEKILRIFDLNRPDATPMEVEKSPGSVRTLSWLHGDQTILSSCTDMGGVRLWDVRTGKIVQTLETKYPVTSAEVSPDGRYITTADGSTIRFWDANHFGLVKSYDMPCTVESASLEPRSGNKFIAGGEDMWVRLFDFHSGKELTCNKGHHGPVHCVRFAPEGESYASGSEDGTIRIWQTSTTDENEMLAPNDMTGKGKFGANEDLTQEVDALHIKKGGSVATED
ncbi:hypothetical protein Taro_021443 [Colocasia esculenta]|uniref:Serine-threonine kinase receptor-associated protein n=1 Tax=Colocasia esculenta TaxID=4460 RepID=A0A843V500_COLES|nr:hypothetical protein [Colocasia esculenta]